MLLIIFGFVLFILFLNLLIRTLKLENINQKIKEANLYGLLAILLLNPVGILFSMLFFAHFGPLIGYISAVYFVYSKSKFKFSIMFFALVILVTILTYISGRFVVDTMTKF